MERIRQYTAAIVQMDSRNDKAENVRRACAFVDEAAANGARLVCFPENMDLCGRYAGEGGDRETLPGYTTERLAAKAREHGIYIHAGSLRELIPGDERVYNTSVLLDPEGRIVATDRKLHTFDATLPDGSVQNESEWIRPGDRIVTADTALGRLGLSICYDLRFPELYRIMALSGAEVMLIPANFTKPTGRDHWEVLLRARAIENGCYVLAADQVGQKPHFVAYGNSMAADPWGRVIARAGEEPGIIYARIDLDGVASARRRIPSLQNRRSDVYELKTTD